MSKPPDRFTRLVEQVEMYAGDMWYQTPCVSSVDTKKLLRAEHAAVVRLVKRQGDKLINQRYISRADLLTALTARGRGESMTDDDIALWNATIKFVKLAETLEPDLIGCSRKQEREYKAAWKNLRQVLYNRMSVLEPVARGDVRGRGKG